MEHSLERQLLARLAAGDADALGPLYDAYGRRVYHVLLGYGLPEHEAEDALQETFLALLDRGRGVLSIASVEAYLLGIARHQAGRRRHARSRDDVRADESEAGLESAGGSVAPVSPDGLTCRRYLSQLPPEQAEVVVLKVWYGLTFAEIAERMRQPSNTVASRYRYALEKLRGMWGDETDVGRTV